MRVAGCFCAREHISKFNLKRSEEKISVYYLDTKDIML